MKLFLKFRSFKALEVGFLSQNFSIGELRLIAIVVKMDLEKGTLRHDLIFKIFDLDDDL